MADWFRSWHGAPSDPKWRTIARRADARPGDVAAIVWCLLDRASQSKTRGCIEGYDLEVIADTLGYDVDLVERVIKALYEKQIIDSTHYFSAWRARQPEREDGAAERARAWREAKRTQTNANERTVTHVNYPDTDTDTDTEKKETPSLRSGAKKADAPEPASAGEPPAPDAVAPPEPVPKPPRKRPATAIPPDFEPDLSEALRLGLGLDRAIGESAKFRDYAIAKDWRNVDWPAAWRNWCRKAKDDENASVSGHRSGRAEPPHTTIFRALAGAAEARARRDERPADADGGVFADSGGSEENQGGASADRGPVFAHG